MSTKLVNQGSMPIIEEIAQGEYWGRMPIVGRTLDGKNDVVAYFPTGRSPPSRARYLAMQEEDGSLKIEQSRDSKQGQGNPALLYYNAIKLLGNGGIIVTNGAQTDHIFKTYKMLRARGINPSPVALLMESFENGPVMMDSIYKNDQEQDVVERIDITRFEPDFIKPLVPNYTPIVNLVLGEEKAAMCIAFSNHGAVERHYFNIPLIPGQARGLPTYSGVNVPKGEVIPHFEASPLTFPLYITNAGEFVLELDNSLGPKAPGEGVISPGEDFRVGVAAIFRNRATNTLDYKVLNHNQPQEKLEE